MPSASRRERKVVTVVFADLVGFTARAETLDPEDVEAILSPYHARLRGELERFGGTVEKFIGDAVMALFGAPVAHEDDPERAVRAALAIRDFALEEELELRVGITTGEVLVRLDAQPEAGEGMASGDVVNTAARLQSAAPVNGILVDETTYRATRAAVDYRAAAPVEAKGKIAPISVWTAAAARSRFGADVTHHARTALVGRAQELGFLRDAFLRARTTRTPQLVTLVAVPGMGKSRLIHELLTQVVEPDPELVTWRQGRCFAYGDGIAFWALADIVKAQAGITESDTREEAAAKLRAGVESAVPEESDARWVESHLRPLVGLEAETGLGGDRRAEAFAAWRRFLEALAEDRPLVLVLEDIHWADDGLLDFVDEVLDRLSGVPLLVICTARPELLERRPGWGGGKLNASTLGLQPLEPEQTALLISHVLERSVLPAETQAALLARSEGNPLYAEQFAQLYLERGSTDLALPETLQGILAARIDGLALDEKALLQDASVVGKVFWTGTLQRDADAAETLYGLERKGFLNRQRRSSVEHESEWSFAHMLLRDVAYAQIPRADRAAKHRATAEWLEKIGRPDDHAEMLAHHWRSALELARAAGEDVSPLVEPARLALRAAGDRAFAVNAFAAAAAYYGDALALWPPEDDERPVLLAGRARALMLTDDDQAIPALGEARDALLASGDRDAAAEVEARLSVIYWRRGNGEQSTAHAHRAQELTSGSRSRGATRVLVSTARMEAVAGDPARARDLASRALELAHELADDELKALALDTLGQAKINLGDSSGMDDLVLALEIATAASLPAASTVANNLAFVTWLSFDMRRAAELFAEAQSNADRYGDVGAARTLQVQNANMALVLGRWNEASHLLEGLSAQQESGVSSFLAPDILRGRARLREAAGDLDGALDDYRAALGLARTTGNPGLLLQHVGTTAFVLEERGLVAEARALASEALALALKVPHKACWALPYEFLLSDVAVELADEFREAIRDAPPPRWRELVLACLEREFGRAADLWAEAGSPAWEARYRLHAAEKLVEAGRAAESETQAARAAEFYGDVGAPYFLERAERLLPRAASA